MQNRPFLLAMTALTWAPAVWFAHFSGVYFAATVFCLDPWRQTRILDWPALDVAIVVLTLIAVAALSIGLLRQWLSHEKSADEHPLAQQTNDVLPPLLQGLSLIAVVWQASVALLVPSC